MYYQIRLPLACLLILVYCYWYYSRKKRLHTRTARTFSMLSAFSAVHLVAAVVTEYTVNNRDKVSPVFNYVWHIIFLTSLTCSCCLLLYYLIQYIERGICRQRKREKAVLLVICIVGIITQIFLPIEYVDTENGSYSLGPKAYSLYVVVAYVLIMMLVNLIRYRSIIDKEKSSVLLASVGVFAIIAIIQIHWPYMLLTGMALTMIIVGIMANTEDAHLYVSHKTGLYNKLGCREILQERILAGKAFQIGVYIFIGDDIKIENAMASLEKKFPEKKTNLMCGKMADNVLVVLPFMNWFKTAQFPEKLPDPDIKKDSLKYKSEIVRFEGNENVEQIVSTVRNMKKQYEESVLHKDELTGLLRREAFIRQVDFMVSQGQAFSMLMIDLDDFKVFNDTYGHTMGDEVLVFAAKAFRQAVRSSDIICRMGGDEFAIALCGVVEKEKIWEITDRIRENLLAADFLPTDEHKISISAGVTVYQSEKDMPSFQELYEEADSALYRSKYHGKNNVSFVEI